MDAGMDSRGSLETTACIRFVLFKPGTGLLPIDTNYVTVMIIVVMTVEVVLFYGGNRYTNVLHSVWSTIYSDISHRKTDMIHSLYLQKITSETTPKTSRRE